MRHALLCALVFAGCQSHEKSAPPTKNEPAPPAKSEPAPTSSANVAPADKDEPRNQQPQLPLPPLPNPLPGQRKDLTGAVGSAWRAALGDLDGDHDLELVVVDSKQLRVLDARTGAEIANMPVTAGIQLLRTADIDGDGRAEILAGWGITRDFMGAKARFSIVRLQGKKLVEETLAAPETTRQDVTAIVPMPDVKALLLAYFDSKFNVTSTVARHGAQGWQLEKIASIRMATSYARGDVDGDGKPDLVVGRLYGDGIGIDGDAFVLAPDGKRTMLPTTRGVRSLAISGNDIFVGDGWHQNYGKHARGLLTRIHHGADGFHADLVENTPGQYTIERILTATIDGKPALVTQGSNYVRVYKQDGDNWRGLTIAGMARDIAVGNVDGKPGDEIVVIGDKSELVELAGAAWQ